MNDINKSIDADFPIISQTSNEDKVVLLKLKEIMRSLNKYSYLEIGTYLGGSMTPFINDNKCEKILSVDDRERATPDDRGNKINYLNVKEDDVKNKLKEHNLNIEKVEFFNGSMNDIALDKKNFDLCFIDAEHTDTACFRDFIYAMKIIKDDSIIVLHDSHIIYKALIMINELLISEKKKFKFIKIINSSMSIFFLNNFYQDKFINMFDYEKDIEKFYKSSERRRLEANVKNRVKVSLNLSVEEAIMKDKIY